MSSQPAEEPKVGWRPVLRVLSLLLGAAFLAFAWRVHKLPLQPGGGFHWRVELFRYGAALSGALFALVTMFAWALPWVLNRLEGRTAASFVAARHVRASKSGFLTLISVLSICGVGLGSCSLCGVTSVMGGFSTDLKRKILGNNAHLTIDTNQAHGFTDWEPVLERVRLVPEVAGATPVVRGEVMASSASNTAGAIVRGVDPGSIGNVIDLVKNIEVGKFEYLEHPELLARMKADEVIGLGPGGEAYVKGPDFSDPPPSVSTTLPAAKAPGTADLDPDVLKALAAPPARPSLIVGREFAKTLHVFVGDEITLVSPIGDLGPMGIMPRSRKFRIAAIFHSGMYDYDANHVYMLLGAAQKLFSVGSSISAIEVRVNDAERAAETRPVLEAVASRTDLRVRDWRELNKNLFSALKLERFATFIILSLEILVASFCIVCTLLLMVTEKGKEIAILKAIGASDRLVLKTFMYEGMIIGAIGTVVGVVLALALSLGLNAFGVRLDPDVYYIDRLPIAVNWYDYVVITIASFVITSLSTIYPAAAASQLRPVDGLRYE